MFKGTVTQSFARSSLGREVEIGVATLGQCEYINYINEYSKKYQVSVEPHKPLPEKLF